MEHLLIKPRYADYFSSSHKLLNSLGYRPVFSRDRFLAISKFWHVCDEKDPNLNKSDKLHKVHPISEPMLTTCQHYYSPQQMLSIDEGMVPSKNRLSFKHIAKTNLPNGIKTFILSDSRNGYLYNAEVYVGKSDDSLHPELGATGIVVRPTTSCFADWSKCSHVTLSIIECQEVV